MAFGIFKLIHKIKEIVMVNDTIILNGIEYIYTTKKDDTITLFQIGVN